MKFDRIIHDLLVCALEGGSNYWYTHLGLHSTPEGDTYEDYKEGGKHADPENYSHPLEVAAMTPGTKVSLIVSDEPDGVGGPCWDEEHWLYVFGPEELTKGFDVLRMKYPHHWADAVRGEFDAITGDAFLQCALFGDIVFG